MTPGTRYRMVDEVAGERHVSTVVLLDEEEAREHLHAEATLHALAGWAVTEGTDVIVCRRWETGKVRVIRYEAFGPMDDNPAAA